MLAQAHAWRLRGKPSFLFHSQRVRLTIVTSDRLGFTSQFFQIL